MDLIAPGPMDTPFFYGQETPKRVEFHKPQATGNQLTQIEDIAPIVGFLTTDGWWITGQTTFANGGYATCGAHPHRLRPTFVHGAVTPGETG